MVHHSVGLAWCGTGFSQTGSCIGDPYGIGGPDMLFSYVANPTAETIGTAEVFTGSHPEWVGLIEASAMTALKRAFAKFPARVELASQHTSWFHTERDQEHIVGVVGGWPANSATGQTLDLNHSAVYYWTILDNAQIATGYPEGQGAPCGQSWCSLRPSYPPQTSDEVAAFKKLLAAFGTGVGNSAAHELAHQFQARGVLLSFLDCGNDSQHPGGPIACEGSDNFLYEFFSGSGLPLTGPDGTGAQFKYVAVPGVPAIHWGWSDACALKRYFLNNSTVACDPQ